MPDTRNVSSDQSPQPNHLPGEGARYAARSGWGAADNRRGCETIQTGWRTFAFCHRPEAAEFRFEPAAQTFRYGPVAPTVAPAHGSRIDGSQPPLCLSAEAHGCDQQQRNRYDWGGWSNAQPSALICWAIRQNSTEVKPSGKLETCFIARSMLPGCVSTILLSGN